MASHFHMDSRVGEFNYLEFKLRTSLTSFRLVVIHRFPKVRSPHWTSCLIVTKMYLHLVSQVLFDCLSGQTVGSQCRNFLFDQNALNSQPDVGNVVTMAQSQGGEDVSRSSEHRYWTETLGLKALRGNVPHNSPNCRRRRDWLYKEVQNCHS